MAAPGIRPPLPLDESIPAPSDLAGITGNGKKLRAAFDYLNGLDEPQRSLMCLRIFGGLSFREIAILQGRTEVWARVNFMRCKNRMLEHLEEE